MVLHARTLTAVKSGLGASRKTQWRKLNTIASSLSLFQLLFSSRQRFPSNILLIKDIWWCSDGHRVGGRVLAWQGERRRRGRRWDGKVYGVSLGWQRIRMEIYLERIDGVWRGNRDWWKRKKRNGFSGHCKGGEIIIRERRWCVGGLFDRSWWEGEGLRKGKVLRESPG